MGDDPKRNPTVLQVESSAAPPVRTEGGYGALSLDLAGRLRILQSAIEGGIIPADALAAIESLPVASFLEAFNGGTWDRVLNALPADAQAALKGLVTTAQQMLYNGLDWDRAASTPDTADGIAPGQLGLAGTVARMFAFDGTNFNRVMTEVAEAPGASGINAVVSACNTRGLVGANWDPVAAQAYGSDDFGTGVRGLCSASSIWKFNGASFDRIRTPIKFHTAKFTAAGSSALWAPASGASFRLMRYKIDITGDAIAAAAGDLDIVFYDGATAMPIAETAYVPATADSVFFTSGWIDLSNGILSAAVDNILNLNLSFALTGGVVRVTVAGTEE